MQPEGVILDTQIPGRFIEGRNRVGGIKNYFEHTKKLLFHKIEKTGREVPTRVLKICVDWMIQLKNGGLINHDRTGLIPSSDTGLFFHIKNFPTAYPV